MPDWPEILSRDGPAVWRTAYRLLGNTADADECFQESCLAALKVARRGPVQDWRALLQRLATARSVDRLRARYRQKAREEAYDLSELSGKGPSPLQGAEDSEIMGQLRQALTSLPPQQAEVFCLHALDGWSYAEVAEQMVLKIDHVGVLLHRARKSLRERLAGHDTPQPTATLRQDLS